MRPPRPRPGAIEHEWRSFQFAKAFGFSMPQTFVALHVTTTGLTPGSFITRITSQDVFEDRAKSGETHHLAWEQVGVSLPPTGRPAYVPLTLTRRVHDKWPGENPFRVLHSYLNKLWDLPDGVPVVGHNLFGCCWPMLCNHLGEWVSEAASHLDHVQLIDVGVLHKALTVDRYPFQGESIHDFQVRIGQEAIPGARWSLRHLMNGYQGPHPANDDFYGVESIRILYRKLGDRVRRAAGKAAAMANVRWC
jgi:hypothetical protein